MRIGAWHNVYKSRLRSFSELAKDPAILSQLTNIFNDSSVPEYITKPVSDLSDDEKKLIRVEFHKHANMPTSLLYKWLKDPRVRDGCGRRPFEVVNQRRRIIEIIYLKSSTRIDGSGWTPRRYETARECIFIYQTMFNQKVIDYTLWAILRNFGLDWGRRTPFGWSKVLPKSVRLAALLALARYQKPGKRR